MTLWDAVVVGGGPAGLAVATLAGRGGMKVCVLEARQPPLDKPCGEGLMPDGLAVLEGLGVEGATLGGVPFEGICYLDGARRARGRLPSPGLGVRRTRLHAALAAVAAAAGVELRWGERVLGLDGASVRCAAGEVRGRVVIGADGLRSRVRGWAGLAAGAPRRPRFGVRRHFRRPPWTSDVEVYWGEGTEAYVTPVAADEVGVALLWSGRAGGFDELLGRFPALAARLGDAEPSSRPQGCGPLAQRARSAGAGAVALVGDAAGYLDAITGEGLSLAFREAELLASALVADDLAGYRRQVRRLVRRPELLIRGLLLAERRPWLRRRLLWALSADPALFDRLLAVHCGVAAISPRLLVRLARRIATPRPQEAAR